MIISKVWAMPNARTFSIRPITAFVEKYIAGASVIVDPFANACKYGTITNDLNPEFDTTEHKDALVFLSELGTESADVVLYDPPYSITQAAQCYKSYGRDKLSVQPSNMKYWALCKNNAARILKVGGIFLHFGWNTNGLGRNRGFETLEVLIVNHGGSKNDTLCMAEKKLPKEEMLPI